MQFVKFFFRWSSLMVLGSLFVSQASFANETRSFSGTLKVGKPYSYLYYFGKESGDTVLYFVETNSNVGKKLLSICQDNRPCSVTGSLQSATTVPKGLPEVTSGSFKIMSIGPSADYQTEIETNTICSFINANTVNIRQQPNLTAPVVIQLNRGDGVRAVRRSGNWVKIAARDSRKPPTRYTPLEGYVFNQFINGCSEDQFDRWRK